MRLAKTAFTRTFTLILLLATTLNLFSCGKPEDETLIARAKELIPRTEVVNQLFFEEGIPVLEGGDVAGGYRPADMMQLRSMGFETVASIQAYMREVWCEEFCTIFDSSYLFSAMQDGNSITSFAYCFDAYDGEGTFEGVMVWAEGLSVRTSPVTYRYDTLEVVEKTRRRAVLTMDATVTDENGAGHEVSMEVVLSLDADGEWRLDSHTCYRYFEAPKTKEV